MQYITTTNLRTQSSELVRTLEKGGTVSLVHRSKVVGEIKPKREPKPLTQKDINQLKTIAKEMNLPKMSYEERDKAYREHLLEKYGKHLS